MPVMHLDWPSFLALPPRFLEEEGYGKLGLEVCTLRDPAACSPVPGAAAASGSVLSRKGVNKRVRGHHGIAF